VNRTLEAIRNVSPQVQPIGGSSTCRIIAEDAGGVASVPLQPMGPAEMTTIITSLAQGGHGSRSDPSAER
jgi:hypothetical protein